MKSARLDLIFLCQAELGCAQYGLAWIYRFYWNGLALVRLDFDELGSDEVSLVLLLPAGLSSAGPSWLRLDPAALGWVGLARLSLAELSWNRLG